MPVRAECVSPAECPAGTVQLVPPLVPRSRSPAEDSLTAPQASDMRVYRPTSEVVAVPVKQPRMPPEFDVKVPPGVDTSVNGIGQPACSVPSAPCPSLLTGKTPPL